MQHIIERVDVPVELILDQYIDADRVAIYCATLFFDYNRSHKSSDVMENLGFWQYSRFGIFNMCKEIEKFSYDLGCLISDYIDARVDNGKVIVTQIHKGQTVPIYFADYNTLVSAGRYEKLNYPLDLFLVLAYCRYSAINPYYTTEFEDVVDYTGLPMKRVRKACMTLLKYGFFHA